MRRKRLERGSEGELWQLHRLSGKLLLPKVRGFRKGSCSRNCFNHLQGSGCIKSFRTISAVEMQPIPNPSLSAVYTKLTVLLLLQDSRGFLSKASLGTLHAFPTSWRATWLTGDRSWFSPVV